MYHFEEYKRLHKLSMYMFANQVNAVLEDNKRFGVELTSDSLEASMLFIRLVFQPYNTILNSIASIGLTLTRVADGAEFLTSKRNDVTNDTYQFGLDTNFDSDLNDKKDLKGFMDLISTPFISKQSLSTLCKKYLKMEGTWL